MKCRNTGRTHFKKGMVPWNKGKTFSLAAKEKMRGINSPHFKDGCSVRPNYCLDCGKKIYWKSKRCAPCRYKFAHGENASNKKKGLPKCLDCGKELKNYGRKRCMACFYKHNTGPNHHYYRVSRFGKGSPNWKGGLSKVTRALRTCLNYRLWRSDVFTRDNFICRDCGVRGGYLHAHHLKSVKQILIDNNLKTSAQLYGCDELWNLNNGVTLCKSCHKKIHRWRVTLRVS